MKYGSPLLQKTFLTKSYIKFGVTFEDVKTIVKENSILEDLPEITGSMEDLTMVGLFGELDLDFRNGTIYATKGSRLYLRHQSNWILNKNNEPYGLPPI